MNFQQIEYALALEQVGHFGKASEICNVTQATLSGMIKKLEEEIGYPLFDRTSHPIQVTEKGIKFLELGREILQKQASMYRLKSEDVKELKGQLTLGIIPTIANSLLPLILPEFLKVNPQLQLQVKEITTEEIIQELNEGRIDLGILATPAGFEFADEQILYYEPMMLYGVQGKEKEFISTNDVRNQKIWLLEEGHCFRNQAMTVCDIKEKSGQTENLEFKGNSFETLLNLSDMFGGFTLIPELYYKELSPSKKAKVKSFKTPIPVREVSLVSTRPLATQSAMIYLSEFIRQRIPQKLSSSNIPNKELEIIGI